MNHVGPTPDDHAGVGAAGPHFCPGAHRARRENTVAQRELFRHVRGIQAVSDPAVLTSSFNNGVKRLRAEI